ncbi:hypothetical protein ABZ759_02950 [Streptomyces sp. NPDC047860]|uniref:hypothetical protein n=1 Tax=Streptomyces sp. NPDC047860 TaxID=3155743 RepID=UPI0033D2DA32
MPTKTAQAAQRPRTGERIMTAISRDPLTAPHAVRNDAILAAPPCSPPSSRCSSTTTAGPTRSAGRCCSPPMRHCRGDAAALCWSCCW